VNQHLEGNDMRKWIIGGTVAFLLAGPGVGAALAAKPDGRAPNPNSNAQGCFGQFASAITHNGLEVSGNGGVDDHTTYPGSRADRVHAIVDVCH
jgi:hypothetical protein